MRTVSEIQDELTDIVYGFFVDQPDTFNNMDLISKYQDVYETTSFLFEDYRKDFERNMIIKLEGHINEENLSIEGIVFTSWIAIEVMKRITDYNDSRIKHEIMKKE